jgi:hypothetical protein
LFDVNFPTNTWQLRSAVRFDFPANVILPPNGYVLVVGFDPNLHLNDLHAFRQQYPLDSSVTLLGPFEGRLDNSGERVRLLKPDSPERTPGVEFGYVPYVVVDEVDYENREPWPANANGTGFSIQRIVGHVYGSEPYNWHAATPTPGAVNMSTLRDTNQDGLPDWWKLTHGLNPASAEGLDGPGGDPDEDGFTHREEFIAGTDPRDPLSYLRFDTIIPMGNGVRLQFQAAPNRTYSILYRNTIGDGGWQKLVDVPAQAEPGDVLLHDSNFGSRSGRFYRIVIPQ